MPMTTTVAASGAPEPLPRVWLILGQKAGDNEQVLTLAESLGWPYEIKRFTFKSYELWSNLLLGPNLLGVDKKESCDLGPPPVIRIEPYLTLQPSFNSAYAKRETPVI